MKQHDIHRLYDYFHNVVALNLPQKHFVGMNCFYKFLFQTINIVLILISRYIK